MTNINDKIKTLLNKQAEAFDSKKDIVVVSSVGKDLPFYFPKSEVIELTDKQAHNIKNAYEFLNQNGNIIFITDAKDLKKSQESIKGKLDKKLHAKIKTVHLSTRDIKEHMNLKPCLVRKALPFTVYQDNSKLKFAGNSNCGLKNIKSAPKKILDKQLEKIRKKICGCDKNKSNNNSKPNDNSKPTKTR